MKDEGAFVVKVRVDVNRQVGAREVCICCTRNNRENWGLPILITEMNGWQARPPPLCLYSWHSRHWGPSIHIPRVYKTVGTNYYYNEAVCTVD